MTHPISLGFTFLQPSPHLQCPLCSKPFSRPQRLHPCAHTFCDQCILKGNHNSLCPLCKIKIILKQNDLMAANLVSDMKVRCNSVGCPWKGSMEDYTNFHQKSCVHSAGGIDAWLNSIHKTIKDLQPFTEKKEQNSKKQVIQITDDIPLPQIASKGIKIKNMIFEKLQKMSNQDRVNRQKIEQIANKYHKKQQNSLDDSSDLQDMEQQYYQFEDQKYQPSQLPNQAINPKYWKSNFISVNPKFTSKK